MKLISLKCPECKADLNIEEGRKMCYCQYCGTRILIDDNSSTRTYLKIDEARIKEAEVDKAIRLKELEIEQMKLQNEERTRNRTRKFMMTMGISSFILAIFCLFLSYITKEGLFLMVGVFAILLGMMFSLLATPDDHD